MSGPLTQRPRDLSITGLGLNASDTVGRSLARAFDFFFPDVELQHPLPFKQGKFDFVTLSEVALERGLSVEFLVATKELLKAHGFLVVSRKSLATAETNHLGKARFVEVIGEAGFKFIEEVPIIPTLGVPAIPNPDVWVAYSR